VRGVSGSGTQTEGHPALLLPPCSMSLSVTVNSINSIIDTIVVDSIVDSIVNSNIHSIIN
jgi:hypothetical protein